jgi:hypothetical protein
MSCPEVLELTDLACAASSACTAGIRAGRCISRVWREALEELLEVKPPFARRVDCCDPSALDISNVAEVATALVMSRPTQKLRWMTKLPCCGTSEGGYDIDVDS